MITVHNEVAPSSPALLLQLLLHDLMIMIITGKTAAAYSWLYFAPLDGGGRGDDDDGALKRRRQKTGMTCSGAWKI